MRSPTCSPTSPSAAHDAPQSDAKAREQLERRRQRNRESMRRVRQRKRGAKEDAQRSVAQLERQLQALVAASKRQAQRLQGDDGAMAELLAQTAALSVANQRLRAQVHKFQEAEAAVQRMLTDESARPPPVEQLDECDDNQDAHAGFDDISLAPLLEWLMIDGQMGKLMDLATLKIFENAEITRSLVPRGNMALGWEDRRCIDASATARYHLSKRFLHNSRTRPLFDKTWHATTDMKRLASVMRWAHGMKVLQWLNPDAAVVARELEIPNSRPEQGFSSTRFRFTLIVFRRALPNGQGFLIGTCNLNVYGSSVDECLAKDVSFHMGVNAHTMYGWVFTPIVDPSTKLEAGADVTLVGLTTNGQRAYAHNVLMEMVTVVLLWENAFVGPILRIKPS